MCVFGIFYTAPLSHSWMMFFVTVMAGLLYGLLGVLHPGLLLLRFQETAVGAIGAAIGVALLPVTTHAATNAWIERAVTCVHTCTTAAARRLAGDPAADPAPHAAELELLLGRVRLSLAPLVHPLSSLRARKARARRVLALLDDCAREIRASPPSPPTRTPRTTPGSRPPPGASRPPSTPSCPRRSPHGPRSPRRPGCRTTTPAPRPPSATCTAWSRPSSTSRRPCAPPRARPWSRPPEPTARTRGRNRCPGSGPLV